MGWPAVVTFWCDGNVLGVSLLNIYVIISISKPNYIWLMQSDIVMYGGSDNDVFWVVLVLYTTIWIGHWLIIENTIRDASDFLCWLYKVVFHGLGIRDEWCTYHISKPYYEQYMYMYTACVYIDSIDYMFRVVCWKVLLFLQCDLIVQNITWIYAYQPRLSRINPLQKQLFQRGFWISLRNN